MSHRTRYVRRIGRDVWHFCRNCSHWPKVLNGRPIIQTDKKPTSGELCNECKAKERREALGSKP